jgi:hypothetical protein
MKQIPMQLTPIQKEMLDNGASYVVVPIELSEYQRIHKNNIQQITWQGNDSYWRNIEIPYQIGDEIFFQEEFETCSIKNDNRKILYREKDTEFENRIIWKPYDKMTYEQSRYKYKILDIEIVRVQNLNDKHIYSCGIEREDTEIMLENGDTIGCYISLNSSFEKYFNQLMQQQNETVRYEDNPYIALIKIKE